MRGFNKKLIQIVIIVSMFGVAILWLWLTNVSLNHQYKDIQRTEVLFSKAMALFVAKGGPHFINSTAFSSSFPLRGWLIKMLDEQGAEGIAVAYSEPKMYQITFEVFDMAKLVNIIYLLEDEAHIGIESMFVQPKVGGFGLAVELRSRHYE